MSCYFLYGSFGWGRRFYALHITVYLRKKIHELFELFFLDLAHAGYTQRFAIESQVLDSSGVCATEIIHHEDLCVSLAVLGGLYGERSHPLEFDEAKFDCSDTFGIVTLLGQHNLLKGNFSILEIDCSGTIDVQP